MSVTPSGLAECVKLSSICLCRRDILVRISVHIIFSVTVIIQYCENLSKCKYTCKQRLVNMENETKIVFRYFNGFSWENAGIKFQQDCLVKKLKCQYFSSTAIVCDVRNVGNSFAGANTGAHLKLWGIFSRKLGADEIRYSEFPRTVWWFFPKKMGNP